MNYLLKIVQGANAGAEIALADGVVTFGSADTCDIVLSDSSLPAEAFALETTEAGVSLKTLPDGEAKKLDLYTTFTVGNSAFAVGENGVTWPELKAAPVAEPETPRSGETPLPPAEPTDEPARTAESTVPTPPPPEEKQPPTRKRSGCGCLIAVIIAILLFVLGYFLALRYGRIWERYGIGSSQESSLGESGASPLQGRDGAQPSQEDLSAWAASKGVTVAQKDDETILSGNFAKRSERHDFMQEAYARDTGLMLDISDDETLKSGVEEVLFVLTEGRTKLDVATNRVVKLSGRARSREELLHTVAAICTDVNHVRVVDDTAVVCDDGLRTNAPTRYQALSSQAAKKHPFATPAAKPGMPAPKCPVAGVILMPYPCLVMRDGSRAAEGSMVGEFKVEKIEADKVTLKRGEETITWKP